MGIKCKLGKFPFASTKIVQKKYATLIDQKKKASCQSVQFNKDHPYS